jgi:hypothetical protein
MALQNLGRLQEAVQAFQECVKLSVRHCAHATPLLPLSPCLWPLCVLLSVSQPQTADFAKALDAAKKEMFKGMSESEILKLEGNEVSRAALWHLTSRAHRWPGLWFVSSSKPAKSMTPSKNTPCMWAVCVCCDFNQWQWRSLLALAFGVV